MINLIGTFFSEAKKVSITFKADNSFTLVGIKGFETEFGRYQIGSSLQIPGFPETIIMKESTRPVDLLRSQTYYMAVNCIDEDTFATISTIFCSWIEDEPQPTIYKRTDFSK
ncbi:hypothetical protein WG906_08755 [Pedobacter sp. P351]|uniref:hypothetical protein n=1 Tax=Pedobacter superstes TaxID=3133441 RepID=UPI0030970A07